MDGLSGGNLRRGFGVFARTPRSLLRSGVVFVRRPFEARRLVVLVQVGLESEGLIAALASVVLEGRVCLHVGAEV